MNLGPVTLAHYLSLGGILFALSVGEDGKVLCDVHTADVEFDLNELRAA